MLGWNSEQKVKKSKTATERVFSQTHAKESTGRRAGEDIKRKDQRHVHAISPVNLVQINTEVSSPQYSRN
ncbi:MAG: hypothetical protein ACI857_003312 [Arenicella sp.]|jgi:hypothetical protein